MSNEHEHLSFGAAANGLGRAFLVGIGLNVAFVVLEAVFGALAHSK